MQNPMGPSQGSLTAKNCLMQKVRGTEVEQPCFPGLVLERALRGRSIFSDWQMKLFAGVAEWGCVTCTVGVLSVTDIDKGNGNRKSLLNFVSCVL